MMSKNNRKITGNFIFFKLLSIFFNAYKLKTKGFIFKLKIKRFLSKISTAYEYLLNHLFTHSSSKKQGHVPSPAFSLGGIKPSPPAWSLPEGVAAFLTNLACPPPHSLPQFSKADSLDFTECILEFDLPRFLISCLLCLKCSFSVCLPEKLSSASP